MSSDCFPLRLVVQGMERGTGLDLGAVVLALVGEEEEEEEEADGP
jgi:hypothetical protein